MASSSPEMRFRIWAVDNIVYGPVDLPTLISWARDERVTSDTWVFTDEDTGWHRAGEITELATAVNWGSRDPEALPNDLRVTSQSAASANLRPIFAGLSDEQLAQFVQLMEVVKVRQFTELVRAGSPGEAMYLILDGELRARLMAGDTETTLATLETGECFGEIALFDHGLRSADVVANKDSTLLKIGAGAVQKLVQERPELAAPFLWAIGKTLSGRIRVDNKRHQTSFLMAKAVRGGN
jgi:CRP-like cAMP-binding protein